MLSAPIEEVVACPEFAATLDELQGPQSAQSIVETATIRFVASSCGALFLYFAKSMDNGHAAAGANKRLCARVAAAVVKQGKRLQAESGPSFHLSLDSVFRVDGGRDS
jgi:hypothetical protein